MATQPRSRKRNRRRGPVGRQVRTLALQFLYTHDVRGGDDDDIGATLDWLCAEEPATPAVRRNAQAMASGILNDVANLDATIQNYAPALPVNLLAIVDRNILRVAIYELTASERAPNRVIINEATELASMFGSESSARFVNGVLGSVLNSLSNIAETALTQGADSQ